MANSPAQWHSDPSGKHQLRYWDGTAWTDHVSDNGVTGSDPIGAPPAVATVTDVPSSASNVAPNVVPAFDPEQAAKIQAQVSGDGMRGAGIPLSGAGGGTLWTEAVLVVNQKAKLIEVTNQYKVCDQTGREIATVNQVGQSTMKKVMRVVSSLDQFMTHTLEIRDSAGHLQMQLTRPRKFMKSSVIVQNSAGNEIGRIVQENMIGKIHFALEANGQAIGAIRAENWRAWNFRIEDASGAEVARITKTFEGVLKTAFTTADNYVLQIHQQLAEPLHSMVIASALSVDTALKQDSRGFG